MAKITLEPGDICEVEDNQDSHWKPTSVDDLIVELIEKVPAGWVVKSMSSSMAGVVAEIYLHLKT